MRKTCGALSFPDGAWTEPNERPKKTTMAGILMMTQLGICDDFDEEKKNCLGFDKSSLGFDANHTKGTRKVTR